MQTFLPSSNPVTVARWLDSKRLNKQILECYQILNVLSGKEWGIWGGIYLESGEISKEFNSHKTKKDWSYTWQALTMEN